ncbi:MAG: hypothetical protein P8M80_02195 [Pirellulaceae bacterium]|nr:hypothetical protein [Pirellulaceae bacterium]
MNRLKRIHLTCWLFLLMLQVGFAECEAGDDRYDDPTIGLKVDLERVKSNGIRVISGNHLTLFTDLPRSKSIDELPAVFDAAVPQWSKFFLVPENRIAGFSVVGFLIKDLRKFRSSGLIPSKLPPFKNGYTFGKRSFWMYDQPSDFMRRQLLIHEGTHSFIFSLLGERVRPWLNEGLAELFGSHQWQENRLSTAVRIDSREEAPFWGRTKVIRDHVDQFGHLSIQEILSYQSSAFLKVDSYGWAWALSSFLHSHPLYRERFGKLASSISNPEDVNRQFASLFQSDREELEEQWSAFVWDLDYGLDGEHSAIQYTPVQRKNETLPIIAANRSWQSSGVSVVAGKTYWIRSRGRFVIRQTDDQNGKPVAWPCETNGITLEYYRGNPLGVLMANIRVEPHGDRSNRMDFGKQMKIGLSKTFKPTESGMLFFRVNEFPGGYGDNSGELLVSVVEKEE